VFISLDPRSGEHHLRDVDDFTAFAVVVPSTNDLPLAPETVPSSLGQVAADGRHVFVWRDTVRALAGPAADSEEWQAGFDAMLAYAERSGWLTPDGAGIRAHCTTEVNPAPATGA
jgi:hypothetical protein